jgi:hypothetical protein
VADSSTKRPEFKDFGVSGLVGLNLDQGSGFPSENTHADVRAPDHYRVIGKTGIFVIY